jgi:competence protein ComEA
MCARAMQARGVPALSRSQIVVFAAIAVAVLLVGARAIRSGAAEEPYALEASGQAEAAQSGIAISGDGPDVVVDVTGAVRDPGVYRLPAGARVNDAVARAGGASGEAVLEGINLAARLADGQQVLVPGRTGGTEAVGATAEEGPISLGSAGVEELETIDGIGPVTAGDIVEFRDEHGGLASVDQLDEVPGIGPATMEALRSRLQP